MQEEYKPAAIYSPISIGNWIISLILTMIPIVNIIMLFVWAFSNGTNPTKANWAKAALILILCGSSWELSSEDILCECFTGIIRHIKKITARQTSSLNVFLVTTVTVVKINL